jgi:hypothetical protein
MRVIAAAVLCSTLCSTARAQLTRDPAAGAFSYRITGVFQGQPMAPWRGQFETRDTTVSDKPALLVSYLVLRPEQNASFLLNAAWTKAPGETVIRIDNRGRQPNQCSLRVASDRATGTITGGLDPAVEAKPVELKGDVVADFAMGHWVAARRISEGDTIRATIIRCLPQFREGAIATLPFAGIVKSGERPRLPDGPNEPAWIIEGRPDYPMVIVLAKRDKQLLSLTIPQGTVGSETLEFLGPAAVSGRKLP